MTANAGKVTHKYEVKNVRVVLDILNFLSASHSGEKLSPFARKMGGVSKNRLFRTLSTLETEAFVSKSSEGDYQLGPAAYGLAKGILLDVDGAVTLRPVMRRLGATTREAVYLGLGGLFAITAFLFHSFTTFNFHIPANALYFTVIAALTLKTLHNKS